MNEAFPDIQKIQFEGPKSRNPLAFKHYNADELVGGKKMRDHLRFGVAYWHAMRNSLSDPIGGGTAQRPWDDGSNSVANAQRRVWACFEFMDKLGVERRRRAEDGARVDPGRDGEHRDAHAEAREVEGGDVAAPDARAAVGRRHAARCPARP